jgi:hypothetical protein
MIRLVGVVTAGALLAAASCATAPGEGSGGQQLIADTMSEVCVPAALNKSTPLAEIMMSSVGKRYVESGPLRWSAPTALTDLQVTQQGCTLTYYGGFHNEVRADQLAQADRNAFKLLYTGPNATGGTIRDVLCLDRPDGSSAGIIMSTSKVGPDGRIPMVMISTVFQPDTCAVSAEKSVIAIPRIATRPPQ